MKPLKSLLMPTLLGLSVLSTGAIAGGEKKISEGQVPKPVLEAFHNAYPHAADLKYEADSKSGKTVYEIEFKHQGIEREVTYSANGTLLETEEAIKPDALPAAITEALRKAHPHATLEEVEQVMEPDGKVNGYEVEIKDGQKVWEVHLDIAGRILKTETEKEEDETE